MSIDQTKHSLFGASKVAADVLVQEYGQYFGMNTGVFRGGCLTGPNHSGTQLHGFLSYLMKCAITGDKYTVFGYQGKQVRDNIHSYDVARFIEEFIAAPRFGEVYNIGGGKQNTCSILEAFAISERFTGKKMNYVYDPTNRIGDHICYYSDLRKMKQHYPNWDITKSLEDTIKEIVDNQEIKTIFLLGVDDDIDFNALKDKFIIYLGSHGDNGANVADIILPCPAYTEKEATFINFEGRAQISSLSTFPIGDAKAEWQFILEIAKKMSITLDFDDISQLRMLISNHKAIANLNNPTPESAISLNEEVNILDSQLKIIAQKYDFYLTNVIARASRILNRCSTFNDNK